MALQKVNLICADFSLKAIAYKAKIKQNSTYNFKPIIISKLKRLGL